MNELTESLIVTVLLGRFEKQSVILEFYAHIQPPLSTVSNEYMEKRYPAKHTRCMCMHTYNSAHGFITSLTAKSTIVHSQLCLLVYITLYLSQILLIF